MCIAIPMRLVEIMPGQNGMVEFSGVHCKVNLKLLENCEIGDYLLIHAGYAIEKMDSSSAEQNLQDMATMRKLLES